MPKAESVANFSVCLDLFPKHPRSCLPMGLLPEVLPTGTSDSRGPSRRELNFSSLQTFSPPGFLISLGASPSIQLPKTNNGPVLKTPPSLSLAFNQWLGPVNCTSLNSLESVPLRILLSVPLQIATATISSLDNWLGFLRFPASSLSPFKSILLPKSCFFQPLCLCTCSSFYLEYPFLSYCHQIILTQTSTEHEPGVCDELELCKLICVIVFTVLFPVPWGSVPFPPPP